MIGRAEMSHAISHDDAKRVSQGYRPPAVLDFLNEIFNGRRT